MPPSERTLQAKRDKVLVLADSKQGYISRAWLQAIQAIKDVATLDKLIVALSNNDVYAIQRLITPENVQLQLAGFKEAMTQTYMATGVALAQMEPSIAITFNQVNPRLVSIVNNWSNTLITNESQATIQMIGREIGKATIEGKNPIESARRIRSFIGLTPEQQRAVDNYERKLRAGEDVTTYKLRDKRLDTKRTLKEADIQKRVDRYIEKQLKYRAEVIARTEALRMVSMANQHIYENAIEEGKIRPNDYRRYWVATRDLRTRDAHRAMKAYNPEGRAINEPFKSPLGDIMYPHDPNARPANTIHCRCVLIYSLEAEAFL